MRFFILGIDGLDYRVVEKLDLKNLKQEEYGTVEVPINKLAGMPVSCEVWNSFLTGKYTPMRFQNSNPFVDKLNKILILLRRKIPFGFNIKERIEGNLKTTKKYPGLKDKTFIDELDANYYNAPFYDFEFEKTSKEIMKLVNNEITYVEAREFYLKEFEKYKKELLEKLEKNKKQVFFSYTNFIDGIQHHFYKDENFLKEKHKEIDEFVNKINKNFNADFVLIVSDHGHENGKHKAPGFYSLNKKMNLKKPKIEDFYDIILEKNNLPTKKDEKEIKKQLKKLGYI